MGQFAQGQALYWDRLTNWSGQQLETRGLSNSCPKNAARIEGSLGGPRGARGLTQVVEAVGVGARLVRLLHKLEVVWSFVDDEARVLAAAVDDAPEPVPRVLLHLEAGGWVLHLHGVAPVGCRRPGRHPLRPLGIQREATRREGQAGRQ